MKAIDLFLISGSLCLFVAAIWGIILIIQEIDYYWDLDLFKKKK